MTYKELLSLLKKVLSGPRRFGRASNFDWDEIDALDGSSLIIAFVLRP
jgi:hypothetical protein